MTPRTHLEMRLVAGSFAPDFDAESIGGRRVSLEQLRGRPILLKFYRFATCPICKLHMHRFSQEHRMVSEAGLTTVVVYRSPADRLAEEQDYATPFDLVADSEKTMYRAYGVANTPADFIIDALGRIVFAHYGKHSADSLEASDVVDAWRVAEREAATQQVNWRGLPASAWV